MNTPRRNKDGKIISFSIRVFRGRGTDGKQLKPYTTTFEIPESWSEKTARKKAEAYVANFENECKTGIRSNTKQPFASYCDYITSLKQQRGMKHSAIVRYKKLTSRIYPQIGHIKLKDLRVRNLNELYTALSANGLNKRTKGKLSNKTIVEHHRLISIILEQAVKEGLIPFNISHRAQPPKLENKEVNYFKPEQIHAIRKALKNESIKWKTLVHLFLITGARRGEILGLDWDKVDFEGCVIHICNNVLYSPEKGLYEDTPKTPKSKRTISIPIKTVNLLKQYKKISVRKST